MTLSDCINQNEGNPPIGDLVSRHKHIVGEIIRVSARNKFPPFYSVLEGSVYPAKRAINCATASDARPKLAI